MLSGPLRYFEFILHTFEKESSAENGVKTELHIHGLNETESSISFAVVQEPIYLACPDMRGP